LFKKQTKTH